MLQGVQSKANVLLKPIKAPSFQNSQTSEIYAIKGEPTYDKKMDNNNDGKVTFDEFKDYCKENNLSKAEISEMLKNWSQWQIFKSRNVYAKQGDVRYDANMDEDSDGSVTLDEFMRYKQQQEEEISSKDKKEETETDTKLKSDNEEKTEKSSDKLPQAEKTPEDPKTKKLRQAYTAEHKAEFTIETEA